MCTPSSDDLRAWEEIRDVSMRSGLSHAPHTYSIFTESEEKTQCSCSINSFRLFTGLVYFCSSGFSSPKNDFVSSRTASFLFSSSISIDIFGRLALRDSLSVRLLTIHKRFSSRNAVISWHFHFIIWTEHKSEIFSFRCLFRWSVLHRRNTWKRLNDFCRFQTLNKYSGCLQADYDNVWVRFFVFLSLSAFVVAKKKIPFMWLCTRVEARPTGEPYAE